MNFDPYLIDDSVLEQDLYGDVRALASRKETPLHRAADAHVAKLSVVFRYAFAVARKAIRPVLAEAGLGQPGLAQDVSNQAVAAMTEALSRTLPRTIHTVVLAGGRVGMDELGKRLRVAAFNPDQPRDERGQWTSGDVVHHGSTKDFDAFDLTKAGATTDEGWLGRGIYFSTDKKVSHYYPLAYETQVKLDKPLKLTSTSFNDDKRVLVRQALDLPRDATVDQVTTELVKRGHDGVILDYSPTGYKSVEVMALDPKSTTIVKKYETGNTKMWDEKAFGRPEKYRRSLSAVVDLEFRAARDDRRRGPFRMAFDVASPEAIAWADRHAAELIDGISETTREAINNAVAEALEEGDLRGMYDEILEAVGNEERAELIARTEVMTAVSEGQRQAWYQAVDNGLLIGDEKRVWIATDVGACPICEDLDGKTADLHGVYVTSDGDEYEGPIAHPRCRCTEGLT